MRPGITELRFKFGRRKIALFKNKFFLREFVKSPRQRNYTSHLSIQPTIAPRNSKATLSAQQLIKVLSKKKAKQKKGLLKVLKKVELKKKNLAT